MLKFSFVGIFIFATLIIGNANAIDNICQAERNSCKMDRKSCSSSIDAYLPEVEQYIMQVAMFQDCIKDFGPESCQEADMKLRFAGIGLRHSMGTVKIMCDSK